MKICSGKSVLEKIAVGKIYLLEKQTCRIDNNKAKDYKLELLRLDRCVQQAMAELEGLYQMALKQTHKENAMIFEVHRMMLEDPDYLETIKGHICDMQVKAEYAVQQTGEEFYQRFLAIEDEYMKVRAADVRDISQRLIGLLTGNGGSRIEMKEPVILLADDLTPSETVQMDKGKILAFVTRQGALNSHTAILARSMNIPALVGTDIEILPEYHGAYAVVDGFSGKLYLNPENRTLKCLMEKKAQHEQEQSLLLNMIGLENITKDGHKVEVYANIGSLTEVEQALTADAGGIGLFRSEFLYLERDTYPTEEEQFCIYKEVLERMGKRKVIFRTLDIGADKQASYFGLPREENPAMGYRAIRICLDRVDVFKTQLRAIWRASVFGTAAVMFPMIISVEEIKKIRDIIEEVKRELEKNGDAYGAVELGIMIETPAAVMISDELAREVDFFSIGTNDLTQYTLAIDRQNPNLDDRYDAYHPAILRMIRMTVENGHKNGIWVGICGELAADTAMTEAFLKMGVDELSVSPTYILKLRKTIRQIKTV